MVQPRYLRNLYAVSEAQQALLAERAVLVVGCGGLGGYVIEQLARLGVGCIRVVDPDVFEETNLNRQLLASMLNLGKPKVAAAQARVQAINPLVRVDAVQEHFTAHNAPSLLLGVHLVVDALDTIPARLLLQQAAAQAGLPLVHGALAGWRGQVCVVRPGEDLLSQLYPDPAACQGEEVEQGTLAFSVGLVASLMASEAAKVLLGLPTLSRAVLVLDLLSNGFQQFPL